MKVVQLASSQSAWRGCEYYKNGNVISCEQIDEGIYCGKVSGSNGAIYDVMLDINHPRSYHTSCNCPYAKDSKYRVCKHMVALYFTAFPGDVDEFKRYYAEMQNQFAWGSYDDYDDYDDEYDDDDYDDYYDDDNECATEEEKVVRRLERYIYSLSKSELREQLLDLVLNSGEDFFINFIRTHDFDEE